eukprot:2866429-Rhodomonas_salina.1
MAAPGQEQEPGFSQLQECQKLCAQRLFSDALAIADRLYAEAEVEGNEKLMALACTALSSACGGKGEFSAALQHSCKQLELAVKISNVKLQVNAYGNMALALGALGRYDDSVTSLETSLGLLSSQENPDRRQLCVTLLNLASTHADCRQYDKALHWVGRLQTAATELEGEARSEFEGRAHGQLSRIHNAYGKIEAAAKHAELERGLLPADIRAGDDLDDMSEESLKQWLQHVRETNGGVVLECEALRALGRKLLIAKDFEPAVKVFEECLKVRRGSDGVLKLAEDLKAYGASLLLAGRILFRAQRPLCDVYP